MDISDYVAKHTPVLLPNGFIGKRYVWQIDSSICISKLEHIRDMTVVAVTVFTSCGKHELATLIVDVDTKELIAAISDGSVFNKMASIYRDDETEKLRDCKSCQDCEKGYVH